MKTIAILAAGICLAATSSLAQPAGGRHQEMQHGPAMGQGMMQGGMDDYMRAMQPTHQGMMQARDADPDRAFALKMIEHHRGGVAMVDVLMKSGDDAELKRMAEKTKQSQLREISELQAWLARHGGRTPKP